MSTTLQKASVEDFGRLRRESMESFKKACDLYVQDIDRDPELAEVYREAYPDIPAGSWKGFEAVGRDALVPQLLWAEGPLMRESMESFKKACDLYVQDIDRDPELAEVYREAYPDIPAGSWKGFEAVGRDALVPQLLWAEDPGPRALARMPKHVQLKHLDAPVEMLTGKGEVLMVNVRGMSQAQARQVFNRNHVRSLGEQRAWLEEHQPAHDEPEALPYEVRSGKLVVLRPVTFTRAQLQKLLMEV